MRLEVRGLAAKRFLVLRRGGRGEVREGLDDLGFASVAELVEEMRTWWEIHVRARSFLHHQVRFMAGGVIAVGSGRLSLAELKDALAAGKRPTIVKKEAAAGLCFTHVEFAEGRDPFAR